MLPQCYDWAEWTVKRFNPRFYCPVGELTSLGAQLYFTLRTHKRQSSGGREAEHNVDSIFQVEKFNRGSPATFCRADEFENAQYFSARDIQCNRSVLLNQPNIKVE